MVEGIAEVAGLAVFIAIVLALIVEATVLTGLTTVATVRTGTTVATVAAIVSYWPVGILSSRIGRILQNTAKPCAAVWMEREH